MSPPGRPTAGLAVRSALLVAVVAALTGCASSGVASTTSASAVGPGATTERPSETATPAPTSTAGATAGSSRIRPLNVPPRATTAYLEFLARVNADRSTVDGLDRDLSNASAAGDLDAVRRAAVAILDFVDVERDWLLVHPPADCYAEAHASAMSMLEAYGGAADRFVDWSTTGGGLNGLPALSRAADAARTAQAALATFASVLAGTSCRS